MEGLDIKAIIAGDASSFVAAVDSSVEMVEKFRVAQAQELAVGQQFEQALRAQGVGLDEWAQAILHANQEAERGSGITGQLAGVLGNFGSVGKEAASILTGVGDAAGLAGIAFTALAGSVVAVGEFGNKIANLHDVTQLSTHTLALWDEQAAVFGVTAETVALSVERLGQRAEEGNKKTVEGLEKIGMTTESFLSLSPESRFEAVTEAITAIHDPAEKAALAMELFGRGGIQMLPALTEEAEKYRESLKGVAMDTDEAAKKGREWTEATNELHVAWENVYRTIGLAVIEAGKGAWHAMQMTQRGEGDETGLGMAGAKELFEMPSFEDVKGGKSTSGPLLGLPQIDPKQFAEDYKKWKHEEEAAAKHAHDEELKMMRDMESYAYKADEAMEKAKEKQLTAEQKMMRDNQVYAEKVEDADTKAREKAASAQERMMKDMQTYGQKVEDDATRAIQKHKEEEVKTWETVQAGIGMAIQFLQQFGLTADSTAGKLLGLAQAGAGLGAAIASGNPMGIISAGFSVLGSVFGLFHNDVIEKLNDQRDAWFQQQGGVDALEKSLNAMGQTGDEVNVIMKQLYDAKTPEEFKAAVDAVNQAMNEGQQANQALDDAMKKYGISISQLGPQFRQQKMDEEAKALIKDYEVLKGAGVDQSVIIQKMGGDFNKYVQESIKAGTAIPENLRPVIEAMEKAGKLTDAAGNKITDMSKIHFTTSLTEGLQSAVDAINKLVAALQNMYGYANQQAAAGGIQVPVSAGTPAYGPPGTTGQPYHAQEGFFSPSMPPGPLEGGGTALVVHPGEYVSVRPTGGAFGGGGVQGGQVTLHQEYNMHLGTLLGNPEELMKLIAAAVSKGNPDIVQAIQHVAWHSAG